MGLRYNAYQMAVYDEGHWASANRVTSGIVIEVRVGGVKATSGNGALATLYKDPQGKTSMTNPISGADFTDFDRVQFYTTSGTVDVIVRDYGDATAANHPNRFGRFGALFGVTPRDSNKTVILPRYQTIRVVKVPFKATGTDANDLPASWDNAEASCVIAQGSSTTIQLPKGFAILDAFVEVRTADASETMDVGLLSSETNGDADGFLDGISLGSAGIVKPEGDVTLGSNADYWATSTYGALLAEFTAGADTSAASLGEFRRKIFISDQGTASTISITGSAGIDTAEGDIYFIGMLMPMSYVTA